MSRPSPSPCSRRRLIVASIRDEKTKTRFKGYVYDLNLKGDQRIMTVYGDSWESMRDLKHYLTQSVKDYYANNHEQATP